jgi:hypothetical protein
MDQVPLSFKKGSELQRVPPSAGRGACKAPDTIVGVGEGIHEEGRGSELLGLGLWEQDS